MTSPPHRSEGLDPSPVPDPSPLPDPHDVLGRIPTDATLRRELAAAARSRGERSSFAAEIADVNRRLVGMDVPTVDLETARKRVADATGEEERLKERVAAARGDVRARRTVDAEVEGALADLEAAAAELSVVQTERVAAEQALARERDRANAARDARERRLRLQDRLANRRRDARNELACEVYPAFRDALAAVPGVDPEDAGSDPGTYSGNDLAASLAAVRVASLDEPVALTEATLYAIASADRAGGTEEPSIAASGRQTASIPTADAMAVAESVVDGAVVVVRS